MKNLFSLIISTMPSMQFMQHYIWARLAEWLFWTIIGIGGFFILMIIKKILKYKLRKYKK